MQGIILKCDYKISPDVHEKLMDILHDQWLDKGIMLLPHGVNLVGIVSDDKDANIVLYNNKGDDYK